MKILNIILIIVVIMAAFSLNVSATSADSYIDDYEKIIPDDYSDIQAEIRNGGFDLSALSEEIMRILSGHLPSAFTFFMTLVGLSIVMGTVNFVPDKIKEVCETGVSVTLAVFVCVTVSSAFSKAFKSIAEAGSFFSQTIPVLTAITLAGGGVKGAAAQAAGMNIVLSLVGGGFGAALSLLSGFALAMGLASSLGGESTSAVSNFSFGLFKWIFGIATALLMGFLSLQTLISSSRDNAAMRMAKYMAQGSLPMVGGTVSASLSTLGAGLSYAKGVVGASAIAVLILVLLSPLALSLLYRLALSLASEFARLMGISSAAKSYLSFRSAFDMLIGVYCLSGLLYIFEIILFIKSGVAVL